MKTTLIAACLLLAAGSVSAAPPKLTGTWDAARTVDDERVSLVLKDMGKAEIINEYDLSVPNQPKRRGRSTSFGKWAVKGDEVVVTYSKISDRLRYRDQVSLSPLGQEGAAPALVPVGKPPKNSKLGAATLWKGPNDYRLKAQAPAAPAAAPADAPKAAEPPK
jgi:hypothetical protein